MNRITINGYLAKIRTILQEQLKGRSGDHELLKANFLISCLVGRIEKDLNARPWWKKLFNL